MNYCPACGGAMPPADDWPRTCPTCGRQHFRNPTPVSVVLLPVGSGVLAIRRAIPPGQGKLALPGGFVNLGETWQEAGAREVLEETGIAISPDELILRDVQSVPEGVILIFSEARPRREDEVSWQADPAEISEILVLQEPAQLAFSTHTAQLQAYFEA